MHLRLRVVACFTAIAGARVANLMVPQLYRILVDALAGSGDVEPTFPLWAVILYVVLKLFQSLARDVRGAIWLDVEQDTSRRIKLHELRLVVLAGSWRWRAAVGRYHIC